MDKLFLDFLMISFNGAQKRLIKDTTGATARSGGGGGEEEEQRRRGGRISFARARYPENGLAQRTRNTNTDHDFPASSLNLRHIIIGTCISLSSHESISRRIHRHTRVNINRRVYYAVGVGVYV